MESTFDYSDLFPNYPTSFLDITTKSSEVLSSSFIYLLMFILSFCLIYITFRALEYRKWIKKLTKVLKEVSYDIKHGGKNLVGFREYLKTRFDLETYVGQQWKEFDETQVLSHDGRQLFNTVDASYFFNLQTLARGITDSRIISSIPGLLTGIGVLGTFIGLQLGIGGLDMDFDKGSVSDLTGSITPLIEGAAIAFSTSVWGILTSIFFNVYEKSVEAYLRKKITILQDEIDFLYPRIVEAQQLVHINAHSEDTRNTMSKLAEQIGSSMQEALDASLGPAIKQLVDASKDLAEKQGEGSQKVLTELAERFMASMSKEGDKQRENMESGASGLNEAIKSVGLSMNNFMDKFDSQLGEWKIEKDGQVKLTENIIEQGKNLSARSAQSQTAFEQTTTSINEAANKLDNAATRMENFGGEMKSASESISSNQLEATRMSLEVTKENKELVNRFHEMITQIEIVRDRFLEISTELKGSSDGIGVTTNKFLEKMNDQLSDWGEDKNAQQTLSNNLINQSQSITKQANESREALEKITDSISNTSENMDSAAQNISELGKSISNATQIMSTEQSQAAEAFKKSSQESLEVTNNLKFVTEELQGMRQNFTDVGNNIKESSDKVGENFENLNAEVTGHIDKVTNSMEEYRNEVDRMLTEYSVTVGDQTAHRLGEWNHQTNNFSTTLTNAVNSMDEILADIEEKLQNRA
jgi:methyl-accepting chemotaxis protein